MLVGCGAARGRRLAGVARRAPSRVAPDGHSKTWGRIGGHPNPGFPNK